MGKDLNFLEDKNDIDKDSKKEEFAGKSKTFLN
jgi:hypothetical protein